MTNNSSAQRNQASPLDPTANIAVAASAGSGKTYLLVNRIVRLLIDGADPASILAITFTRKAANEMLERVQERLWLLHHCEIDELREILQQEFELEANEKTLQDVRQLYQSVLFAEPGLKISTFHAFCQDILQYFALDAGLPPNFELTEQTYLIADAAWDQLFNELTQNKQHDLRPAIDCLFKHLGSAFNTRSALLDGFLECRSDWWSFTDNQEKPVDYAINVAKDFFKATEAEPEQLFLKQYKTTLINIANLVQNLKQVMYKNIAQAVSQAFDETQTTDKPFTLIKDAFLTKTHTPRVLKTGKTFEKDFGSNADTMLNEYALISDALLETMDAIKRKRLYQLHKSWYQVGHALLDHYQAIKRSRHQLDFSDLEWYGYKLLSKTENAQWIQYKLDSRINHLLIDEFQDTNSTQWQMLLPLLEEMASGNLDRQRSAFLVGDTKQSIYSFRRANPELQDTATSWLKQHVNADTYPLNKSWRSSVAIMQAVNDVFLNKTLISDFSEHDTHKTHLWGQVECWPLFNTPDDEAEESTDFRNPLTTPLYSHATTAHDLEASAIANKITELINQQVCIDENNQAIEYKDIFILLRKRTHASAYEQALANKNIPYTGTEVGTLLDCQEVDDIICLLNFLVTPFNNLALAQLIKSPIFNGTDDDLIQLAQVKSTQSSWFEKLRILHESKQGNSELSESYLKLVNWSQQQHLLPVHDLLNLIYHEGDIIERYSLAMPNNLRSRAKANLQYLLELALNVDSGRYPSIMRFLQHIEKVKSAKDNQKPNSLREQENQNRVQIMTIHAAKGLEAPVVFLADTHTENSNKQTYSCFVNWPTDENKAKQFFLLPKKDDAPNCINELLAVAEKKNAREDSNLLYVAMTRAVHMLFISGTENSRVKNSWYNTIKDALPTETITYKQPKTGLPAEHKVATVQEKAISLSAKPRAYSERFINPSVEGNNKHTDHSPTQSQDEALERGNVIHHILYCLTEGKNISYPASLAAHTIDKDVIEAWQNEARQLIQAPSLKHLYASEQYKQAFNEVPVLLKTQQGIVNGIIDRLLITEKDAIIIDYKTHRVTDTQQLEDIAKSYHVQMRLYKDSIEKLYPEKNSVGLVVFPYSKTCYEVK